MALTSLSSPTCPVNWIFWVAEAIELLSRTERACVDVNRYTFLAKRVKRS